jgi:pilus assembly protein CpaE
MSEPTLLRTIVAVDPGMDRAAVQAAVPDERHIDVVKVLEIYDGSWAVLDETPADVVLVACQEGSPAALPFIEQAVRGRSTRPVVVLVTGSPNGFVRQAFAAGADDIVALADAPGPQQVLFALQKAVARRHGSAGSQDATRGSAVCVLGPKGGAGKTLVACNLAVALAAEGKRVTVVDLDLQFGDVALALGVTPRRTLFDLATSGGSLDTGKLDSYLAAHTSGVRALLAPIRADQAGSIGVELLREAFAVLRRTNDFLVFDTPTAFSPQVMAAIDASTDVCLVGMLDTLSLKNTKLGFEALERMGYDRDRIRLVLNRADSRVGITPDDVAAVVGRAPDASVPSHRDVARSMSEGVPIASDQPRSEAGRAFAALAGLYTATAAGDGAGTVAGKRRRRLRRAA